MPVRDFDDLLAKERTFKVRGESFTWRDVRPEILSAFEPATNGKQPDDAAVWETLDQQIMLFLANGEQERWKELRQREEEPVTIAQITGILQWLMEEQTGRPTNPPSPSASGRGRTAPTSQGA